MKTKRKDTNQPELEKQLRDAGFSVTSLHELGKGVPDLLCGLHGLNIIIEVKHDNDQLTPAEIKWHSEWDGQVRVAQSLGEILLYVSNYAQQLKRILDSVSDHCDRELKKLKTKGDSASE